MAKQTCVYTDTDNHSADIIEVWHGRTTPTYLCGYHEQSRGLPSKWEQSKARAAERLMGAIVNVDPDSRDAYSHVTHHLFAGDTCPVGQPIPQIRKCGFTLKGRTA